MDFEEIEVAPPRAKEVRIKVKHNPDFHVIPKVFSKIIYPFQNFLLRKKATFFFCPGRVREGWCLFTLLSRTRKLTWWGFSSLVSAWNHWAVWKMLTASHPWDSEVIHWLVWRAHIPRWLQLTPRELESSSCDLWFRSLDHFHYSSGKYVLFTDGQQRDNSKFPYPHKPYPPLKEPSLISILSEQGGWYLTSQSSTLQQGYNSHNKF